MCGIACEACLLRIAHGPARVLNFIFRAAAIRLRRIAPVVLGDELAQGAVAGKVVLPSSLLPHRRSSRPGSPGVFGLDGGCFRLRVNSMSHGCAGVLLPIEKPRSDCNRELWNQLANENDTALF